MGKPWGGKIGTHGISACSITQMYKKLTLKAKYFEKIWITPQNSKPRNKPKNTKTHQSLKYDISKNTKIVNAMDTAQNYEIVRLRSVSKNGKKTGYLYEVIIKDKDHEKYYRVFLKSKISKNRLKIKIMFCDYR